MDHLIIPLLAKIYIGAHLNLKRAEIKKRLSQKKKKFKMNLVLLFLYNQNDAKAKA